MDDEFSRYEVYTTAGSVYCYRDSGVLKNRFSLRDGAKLKLVETDLTAIRQNCTRLRGVFLRASFAVYTGISLATSIFLPGITGGRIS